MKNIKKIIVVILFLSITFYANVKADTKVGEVYEIKKVSELNDISMYNTEEEIDEYVKAKLEAMKEYNVIIPKTTSRYEIALAYSDGSFTFLDIADNLEEAKEKIGNIELSQSEESIIPSVISQNGQVVYATNSMGRVWKHINNAPYEDIIYIYHSPEDIGKKFYEYTYVNHNYVDDVPIIEDRGTAAQIQVGGYKGWINKDDISGNYDLVVVPINQITNPSHYYIEDGYLYHYITVDMTDVKDGGTPLKIGPAIPYLKEGTDYYSYDGIYFYEGNTIEEGLNKLINDLKGNVTTNAVNKDNPYYNYYNYLPFRTRTNYTADELNYFIDNNTKDISKLRDIGESLIECQNKYGVNALLMLGVAMNESALGESEKAQNYNNLFGIKAYDFAPQGGQIFDTVEDSIREFAKNYISGGYSNPNDYRYFGSYLGNKALGANVKYASDPFWGEKAAKHSFSIENYLANGDLNNLKDYNGYKLAMYTGSNKITSKDGTLLYNVNEVLSYTGKVVALIYDEKNSEGKYEIFPEVNNPINSNEMTNYNGIYNWNSRGYINSSNLKFINETKNSFIPGYKKEDINKDDNVDIQDLSQIALSYNSLQGSNLFLARYDINLDGVIDIFDMIFISKKI